MLTKIFALLLTLLPFAFGAPQPKGGEAGESTLASPEAPLNFSESGDDEDEDSGVFIDPNG